MKRLLVFVFAVVLFSSCIQQREYFFKFTVLANQSDLTLLQFIGGMGYCSLTDTSGVAVGSSCTTNTYTAAKNGNISAASGPHYDFNNMNATYVWQVDFYVNGNLEDTRIDSSGHATNSSLMNTNGLNFIIP